MNSERIEISNEIGNRIRGAIRKRDYRNIEEYAHYLYENKTLPYFTREREVYVFMLRLCDLGLPKEGPKSSKLHYHRLSLVMYDLKFSGEEGKSVSIIKGINPNFEYPPNNEFIDEYMEEKEARRKRVKETKVNKNKRDLNRTISEKTNTGEDPRKGRGLVRF